MLRPEKDTGLLSNTFHLWDSLSQKLELSRWPDPPVFTPLPQCWVTRLGSKFRPPCSHSKHSYPLSPLSSSCSFTFKWVGPTFYHLLQLSLPNPQCLPSTQDVVISSNLSQQHENGLKTMFFLRLGSQMLLFSECYIYMNFIVIVLLKLCGKFFCLYSIRYSISKPDTDICSSFL